MDEEKCKEIFFNRAEIENAESMLCDNCFERVIFRLKDNDHEFSLGLITILECLEFAIKNGDLPKLPRSWCADTGDAYNIEFDDDISYYDERADKTIGFNPHK